MQQVPEFFAKVTVDHLSKHSSNRLQEFLEGWELGIVWSNRSKKGAILLEKEIIQAEAKMMA